MAQPQAMEPVKLHVAAEEALILSDNLNNIIITLITLIILISLITLIGSASQQSRFRTTVFRVNIHGSLFIMKAFRHMFNIYSGGFYSNGVVDASGLVNLKVLITLIASKGLKPMQS